MENNKMKEKLHVDVPKDQSSKLLLHMVSFMFVAVWLLQVKAHGVGKKLHPQAQKQLEKHSLIQSVRRVALRPRLITTMTKPRHQILKNLLKLKPA